MISQRPLLESLRRPDPERVGPYVLLGRLGAGAMGRVYLGRSAAGRLVAVKTIRLEYAEEPDFRARFAQEVAAARRVSGVFTAAVVAADPDAEVPWLATAYVPAPSLARLVQTCGPLPVPAVRWLAAGCAEALESIHEAGLVHRDLKPSNVLVSHDGPRVIDFGVARVVERIQLTTTHGALGTPTYMAPEQARDTRQASMASDVFSLGSTLFFAATGHAPYQGETVTDVLVRLATEPPDLTGLPRELTGVVSGCLERDPANRPTSGALLAELTPDMQFDADHDGPPSLPGAALALVEDYRQRPQPLAVAADAMAPESTFGSMPTGSRTAGSASIPSESAGPDPSGAGSVATGSTAARFPRARSSSRRPRRFLALPRPSSRWITSAARRSGVTALPPWSASAARRGSGIASALAPVAAVVALVVVGALFGAWVTSSRQVPTQDPRSDSVLGPPPDREPRPPLSGASDRPTGNPSIQVNQPYGDGNTIFVVHGRGWPPGARITVGLAGGPRSPDAPVVDNAGTFNYAVNQRHEFFPETIPPGRYALVATAAGGRTVQVTFRVDPQR